MDNYYDLLEIKKDATTDEIRKAYRRLALKYHPDKNKNLNAQAIFIKINIAHEVLKDDESRTNYNNFINDEVKFDEKEFTDSFNKENIKEKADNYSSMKFEDFEKVVDNIVGISQKVKRGSTIGCGFFLMIIFGILAIISLINIGNLGYPSIILFFLCALLALGGWGMMQD